jgi:hypothetical protein
VTTIIDNTIIGANFELDYNIIMHGFKKDPEIECSRKNWCPSVPQQSLYGEEPSQEENHNTDDDDDDHEHHEHDDEILLVFVITTAYTSTGIFGQCVGSMFILLLIINKSNSLGGCQQSWRK